MTLHTLHAGDGYVYLTRQVASDDVARSSGDRLVDYYQAAGNPPGVWVGSGCRDLGMSGAVTEEHMLALFGEGLRPDANEFIADRVAAGDSFDAALKAARLGRKFYEFANSIPLVDDIRAAYAQFQEAHGRRASVDERRDIKERVAQTRWAKNHPDEPAPSKEQVHRYLVDELGRARQPVAGFDLVFSMIKSAKILWALGGQRIRRIVERIHDWAWRMALAYGEREAGFTRVGANGIAFKKVFGWVATAFMHRDSRAGDPDLHTHVAISNRVLADDGVWRTIDSRQLHKIAVSMSEMYNTLVEWGLTEELGVGWDEVDQGPGKRPIREIAGIPVEWIRGFSQRRTQVEAGYERLVADYVRQHGHPPPRSVQYDLAQQATLENRPAKTELRTLAEQTEDWTRRAEEMLPGVDIPATIQSCLGHAEPRVGPDLEQIAASVVARIAEERSTWAVYHVRAEAHRQLRPHAGFFAHGRELLRAVETVTRVALDRRSILLDVEVEDLPRMLRHPHIPPRSQHEQREEQRDRDRVDHVGPGLEDHLDWADESDAGAEESVFRRRGSRSYTSETILAAEQRLVDDARTSRGAMVPDAVRDVAILRWEQHQREHGKDTTLNPGQRALVTHFVSSGKALAVGIGPPGAGKSTTMAAMRAAWETTGGRVIGFAPSAAAASVLSDDLGVRADTLHSLIVARRNGATVDVKPGDLLLVDEAGMAGTLLLDEVRALAAERGAVVRLLGDYRQLTAVEAGGALRLLHHDVGGIELNEVHRFARPDEAKAVLAFRVGDQAAVDWYVDNDRLVSGVGPAVLDRLYRDWKDDVDAGHTAIMISDSNDVARELSSRAQTERRAAGLVEHEGVRLHDGTIAGVGDRVVTRLNRRNLVLFGGRDYVKNGDLWEVTERFADGRLTVRHVRHGGEVRLSAAYVARHLELGYAATITRSQGLTVTICRSFFTAMTVREAALVALSRGTHDNVAYFDTQQVLAVDEPPILPGDLFYRYREASAAEQALRAILAREGAELSATEQLRNALDEPRRLSRLVPEYGYARQLHRGPAGMQEAEEWVRAALPRYAEEILDEQAWPELARVLHEVRDAGVEPVELLRRRAAERALADDPTDPAQSVAQVLHWRITEKMPLLGTGPHPDRPDLLPGWVTTPPRPENDLHIPGNLAEIVELGTWLRGRAEQIAARVRELGERLAHQITHHTAPPHNGQHSASPTDHQTSEQTSERAPEHAVGAQPDWIAHLGPVPEDPVVREQWIRRAGHVAAYRERWEIPDTDPDLLPDGRGERGRARAWVLAYLRDHPLHHAVTDAAERAARERDDWDQHVDRATDRVRRREHENQQRERRRAEMTALLQQTWRHEPDLVAIILTAAAFDTVAARLSEAADAGYDPREVLADVPLDTLRDPHIHDPAAYTATLIDIAVDRIRTGQTDHDADRRADQQRFAQMLDQAADLLREAWAARPHLAEAVIHAPAFPALVQALDRHTTAGLDARDLLAAIPLAKLDAPTITHTDRYAVYLIHRTAQRQLNALDQARRTAHEHAERLATQRHAATLLRRAWHQHPAPRRAGDQRPRLPPPRRPDAHRSPARPQRPRHPPRPRPGRAHRPARAQPVRHRNLRVQPRDPHRRASDHRASDHADNGAGHRSQAGPPDDSRAGAAQSDHRSPRPRTSARCRGAALDPPTPWQPHRHRVADPHHRGPTGHRSPGPRTRNHPQAGRATTARGRGWTGPPRPTPPRSAHTTPPPRRRRAQHQPARNPVARSP